MPKPSPALFNWLDQRDAGILLHPTCLPGTQGVGVLDNAVDDLLAFLADAGIRYWQTCPLGPTGYGDSPYQCFSAFAGNPYLIDLTVLQDIGLLDKADLAPLAALPQDHVDFGALYAAKWPILFKAFQAFVATPDIALPYGDLEQFKQQHQFWLEPYSLFLAIKDLRHGQPWWEWPETLRFYSRAISAQLPESVQVCAQAHTFFQYLFFGQWQTVRERAHKQGISIIGDAPIFVAPDSADVWSHPELFELDQKTGQLLCVAGVPPDYFSADGQLWGNPLYKWDKHIETGFSWWLERLRANFLLCDVLRIDHFRAFDTYWAIPADAPTAVTGEWRKGPGIAFFKAIAQAIPDARLIAEDLGDLTPSVHALRQATGLPGMAILQFAFGDNASNSYLPHNLHANCVIYPGTHDNDTTQGWYRNAPEKVRDHVRRYLRIDGQDIHWDFVRSAYGSVCNLAVLPLPDLLGQDSSARFNVPGQPAGNWQWRYSADQLATLHRHGAAYLHELGMLFGRTAGPTTSKTL
ncbi:MAG: 4-alpha-glucanotransferase [Formivibrio sp.]|nr:4-alpha-glucanotransferase [Formivibrio sp.]